MDDREKLIELIDRVLQCLPWGEISTHTAKDIADHLISNGVTVQKWIPVDPNKHAYTGNRLIALSNGFVTVGYQYGNGVWVYWRNGSIHATPDVTHWMSLPEPPKECE